MIARVTGELEALEGDSALLHLPVGVALSVALPAFAAGRLGGSIGQTVTLHTFTFLESHAQGATIYPRLAGFLTPEDRAFFELFVTVKGIGHRKALRAMTLGTGQLAAAIADRDLATLQSLPEIGKRTAETIVVSLKGKVDPFVGVDRPTATGSPDEATAPASGGGGIVRDALEVLTQLGENRVQALAWIDQIMATDNAPDTTDAIVAEVYRIKAG